MASFATRTPGETARAATASLLLVIALAAALVLGLRGRVTEAVAPILPSLLFAPDHPPPPPSPATQARPHGKAGAAAARPAGRAAAAPAPPPPLIALAPPLPVPPAIAPATGTLDLPLPGTGAGVAGGGVGGGGTGGSGSGGSGDGTGGGGGSGAVQVAGRLSARDLPHDVLPPGGSLSVGVAYTVSADGRVRDCAVPVSSGFADVDALVCRLLQQRFRFRPARDAAGNPVASAVRETHSWGRRPDRSPARAQAPAGRACTAPMLC
jgi:protein TonB